MAASLGLLVVIPMPTNALTGWVGSDPWRNATFYSASMAVVAVCLTRRNGLLSGRRYGRSALARVGCSILALALVALMVLAAWPGIDPLGTFVVLPAIWASCSMLAAQVLRHPIPSGQAAIGLTLCLIGALSLRTGLWLTGVPALEVPTWPLILCCALLSVVLSVVGLGLVPDDDSRFAVSGVLAGLALIVIGGMLMFVPRFGWAIPALIAGLGIAFGAWSLGSLKDNGLVSFGAAAAGCLTLTTAAAWAAANNHPVFSAGIALMALGFGGIAVARTVDNQRSGSSADTVRVLAALCAAGANGAIGVAIVGSQPLLGVVAVLLGAAIITVPAVSPETAPLRHSLTTRLLAARND